MLTPRTLAIDLTRHPQNDEIRFAVINMRVANIFVAAFAAVVAAESAEAQDGSIFAAVSAIRAGGGDPLLRTWS